jgi:glutamate dehydrogenase (NAD(P)+)
MYLNAGGVTVSYFEWLKNLSPMRYGRMEKRFSENLNTHILGQLEELTGKQVVRRKGIYYAWRRRSGSGLQWPEETMITATHEIMNCWKSNPSIPDMRTAAYVVAINKVRNFVYAELGIFLNKPKAKVW